MAARLIASLAQRVERAAEAEEQHITWAELGCPREIGIYRSGGGQGNLQIRVKQIHIMAAEDEPGAVFTIVTFRPPHGPPEHSLGHRVT
jgi:hypothetical protein